MKPIYQKHRDREEVYGFYIPLLFSEFGRHCVSAYISAINREEDVEEQIEVVKNTLMFIEDILSKGNKYAIDIATTCFLEEISKNNPHYESMKRYIGPMSLLKLKAIDDFWHTPR